MHERVCNASSPRTSCAWYADDGSSARMCGACHLVHRRGKVTINAGMLPSRAVFDELSAEIVRRASALSVPKQR